MWYIFFVCSGSYNIMLISRSRFDFRLGESHMRYVCLSYKRGYIDGCNLLSLDYSILTFHRNVLEVGERRHSCHKGGRTVKYA